MNKQGKESSKKLHKVYDRLPVETELQIENSICQWLAWKQITFWRTKVKGEPHMGKDGKYFIKKTPNPGFQDITCCIKGQFVAIEVKSSTGSQTPKQCEQEEKVLKAGGTYFLAWSIEDVEKNLKQRGLL